MHSNSSPISSITKGPRQSNFELLRIVAMMFVLLVHADFLSLGAPTATDFIDNPANAWTRTLFESMTIVCVNVFVLISGWFGITANLKGLTSFLFQCLFYSIGIFVITLICGYSKITGAGLMECFFLSGGYWFVRTYLMLYILSPILNNFSNFSLFSQRLILILFFIVQTFYGFFGGDTTYTLGMTVIPFIGLYLLGRHLNNSYTTSYKWGGGICVVDVM